MRRSEREILDDDKIDEIIEECKVIRVGFIDCNEVYIVPFNFGFGYTKEGKRAFYIHGAASGRKIDLLKKYPHVGFELDFMSDVFKKGEEDCSYTCGYKSVIGTGEAGILESMKDKINAMDLIMRHYTHKDEYDYNPKAFDMTVIWVIEVDKISCKVHEE